MQAVQLVKCVVVGDSGVGKSSILFRYANNDFDEFNQPTLGAAFVSKTEQVGETVVKFQIWDTAGQEKYQSIAPIYYRQSEIALCVYDISNKKSFAVMSKWVTELQQKGPENMMLVVVGNKSDKVDEEQVSYQEGKDYSDSVKALFRLTSAKQGKGINDMFIAIGEAYLERRNRSQVKNTNRVVIESNGNKSSQKSKKCCS